MTDSHPLEPGPAEMRAMGSAALAFVAATRDVELPWEPQLTVVPFRYRPPAGSGEADAVNARLLERINASGRVVMSSTTLRGRFIIRACILSHRTHRDRVEEAIEIVRAAAGDLEA